MFSLGRREKRDRPRISQNKRAEEVGGVVRRQKEEETIGQDWGIRSTNIQTAKPRGAAWLQKAPSLRGALSFPICIKRPIVELKFQPV
jgi:hypothetical protein